MTIVEVFDGYSLDNNETNQVMPSKFRITDAIMFGHMMSGHLFTKTSLYVPSWLNRCLVYVATPNNSCILDYSTCITDLLRTQEIRVGENQDHSYRPILTTIGLNDYSKLQLQLEWCNESGARMVEGMHLFPYFSMKQVHWILYLAPLTTWSYTMLSYLIIVNVISYQSMMCNVLQCPNTQCDLCW